MSFAENAKQRVDLNSESLRDEPLESISFSCPLICNIPCFDVIFKEISKTHPRFMSVCVRFSRIPQFLFRDAGKGERGRMS